ncbi:MAG: ATP-dependent protease domain protein, partial [uncultured Ramlibacter sp.]
GRTGAARDAARPHDRVRQRAPGPAWPDPQRRPAPRRRRQGPDGVHPM